MLERSNTVVNDNGEELDEGAILSVIVASGSRTTRKMRTRQAIQVTAVQYIVFLQKLFFQSHVLLSVPIGGFVQHCIDLGVY